jgi:hypothetical protein
MGSPLLSCWGALEGLARRGEEVFFFPPFLLPFCSSGMEEIQGLLDAADLKLQCLHSIFKKVNSPPVCLSALIFPSSPHPFCSGVKQLLQVNWEEGKKNQNCFSGRSEGECISCHLDSATMLGR